MPIYCRYDVDKVEIFREVLCNLLEFVFEVADPSCCLAASLQSCISHTALATFGRPSKHKCQQANQKWYDAECKAARAALNHVSHGKSQHSALRKAYKTLIRRKQRAWQRRAEEDLEPQISLEDIQGTAVPAQ